jgi:hypothetical protein
LESEASKREAIIDKLENTYVSAANSNQPMMYTV